MWIRRYDDGCGNCYNSTFHIEHRLDGRRLSATRFQAMEFWLLPQVRGSWILGGFFEGAFYTVLILNGPMMDIQYAKPFPRSGFNKS